MNFIHAYNQVNSPINVQFYVSGSKRDPMDRDNSKLTFDLRFVTSADLNELETSNSISKHENHKSTFS